MADEDRITQLVSQGLPIWEPESRLVQMTQEDIRFSRGFLPCDASKLVNGLSEYWLPLFLTLDANVQITGLSTHLSSPPELEFEAELAFDDEPATLGFSADTCQLLAGTIFSEHTEHGLDVLCEYVARRFVSTVSKSLTYQSELSFKFVSPDSQLEERPVGTMKISLQINGQSADVFLGLGTRAVEYVDSAWRRYITRRTASRGFQYSDQLHTVSIELAELSVEPSVLIDYVRSGTVIELDTPIDSPVLVRLNEVPWFRGTLALFRGCYVVKVAELDCKQTEAEDGKTRVRVELARFQIDQEGVIEGQQIGAMLASRVTAGASANLLIGGEQVAITSIHENSGRFSLTVLPR